MSTPTLVQESVNDLVSFPTAVHESVNDLEVISESIEMPLPDNPTSPQSGSSSRPIVIDSGSVQENVDPVTPVSRRPTEPPVSREQENLEDLEIVLKTPWTLWLTLL